MEYFVYETGASKTIYSESFNKILNYFDDRRNADDRGNYVSFGVMINENSCFDIVGSDRKHIYLINDYKRVMSKHDVDISKPVYDTVSELIDRYKINLQLTSSNLLGGKACLITMENSSFSYMDDKVPLLANNLNIKSCINEVLIEGTGYIPYNDFVKLTYSNDSVNEMPVAKMINVSYVNITGGTGQADLLPAEYLQFIEPYSKEYKLTMYDYNLDRFIPYASFDSKKEAVRMCFDLGIPYLKEHSNSGPEIFDSKGNLVFRTDFYNNLFLDTRKVAESEFGVDFSKAVEPYFNGRLYAQNLDDYYMHQEYYSGKIKNEVPDSSYNEHFVSVKRKSR